MNTKTVCITGATSGIGKACAQIFAQHQYNIIITGRRAERLEVLKTELISQYQVQVLALAFDVREQLQVEEAMNNLPAPFHTIDILINNAGLAAGADPIDQGLLGDWEAMVDTNIKGVLYMSRAIIPIMKKRCQGHIINIGSIAGRMAYPNGNVYCATKSAIKTLTEGMRLDLVDYGIKVSLVAPGAVETEFSLVRLKWDKEAAAKVYEGYEPLHAKDIADVVYYTASLPSHVNIDDVLVMPTAQANPYKFHKEIAKEK